MRNLLRAPISTLVAMATGAALLLSFFFAQLGELRSLILGWVILLAAVALILGLANLVIVHFHKIQAGEGRVVSFVLITALLVTFTITLLQGSTGIIPAWLFNYVQVPMESSLMALLAVTLTLAAARAIQQRSDLMSVVFIGILLILLGGSAPLFGLEIPLFTRSLAPYFGRVLSAGAMRGLLIGVGLGTLATGLRVLLGIDRPYGG
jgi:hypothetical protein